LAALLADEFGGGLRCRWCRVPGARRREPGAGSGDRGWRRLTGWESLRRAPRPCVLSPA